MGYEEDINDFFQQKFNNARKPACVQPLSKADCQGMDSSSQESPPPPYSSKTNIETNM